MLAIASRLGPYEVVAAIAAGGMGEVYRARDTRLDRDVALKVLREHFADDPARRERFEREARVVAALSHPNILSIHDYGEDAGIAYAVMELLEGETLRERLVRGPLSWPEVAELGAAISDGLAAAHAKGVIHRDLKPENLFITVDARLKILDFGLARRIAANDGSTLTAMDVSAATQTGAIMGTIGYMSPEQVRGEPAGETSDLFSLGCVLYESLAGQRVFPRPTAAETMAAILRDDPVGLATFRADVPVELDRIILECLGKQADQRPRSARNVARTLRAVAAGGALHARAASRPPIEAIAVLPFEIVGGDPNSEYLGDGLADHLIISLAQARRHGLKVRPFSSVLRYKRQSAEVYVIGRELNVQVVVTGTLHQPGDNLWISVALVDALEDNQLWGKRYQSKLGSILDVQDQIARDLAENLQLNLNGEEQQRLTKRYTQDPDAYLLYREAMHHWNKFTEPALETCIEYCRRALDKDPNYALAHVGMARALNVQGCLYRGFAQVVAESKRCAAAALAIDESLAEAHAQLATTYMFADWDWPAAERELARAAVLSRSVPLDEPLHGFFLASRGRPADALPAIRRDQARDPSSARCRYEMAMCYNWMRRFDDALAEVRQSLRIDPRFPLAYAELGAACVALNLHDEAAAECRRALDAGLRHPRVTGTLGYVHAAAGNKAEARRTLSALHAEPRLCGAAFEIARIHAALGELDEAFRWLRQACDERTWLVIWLKVDPTLDPLRKDLRFEDVLRQMGLPI